MMRELGAAHVGHPHVGQQHVDRVAVHIEELHRFLAVAGLVHRIAFTGERLGEQLAHGRLVFDEQDRFAGLSCWHHE
jgi:hypothetical protein